MAILRSGEEVVRLENERATLQHKYFWHSKRSSPTSTLNSISSTLESALRQHILTQTLLLLCPGGWGQPIIQCGHKLLHYVYITLCQHVLRQFYKALTLHCNENCRLRQHVLRHHNSTLRVHCPGSTMAHSL